MEPIERLDQNAFESGLAQLLLQSPAYKCGLIRRGISECREKMKLSFQKDLRIQHVRLSKADGAAAFQKGLDSRDGQVDIQMMENGGAYNRIKRPIYIAIFESFLVEGYSVRGQVPLSGLLQQVE